ncbi:MAG TPA: hypothetical protein VGM17_02410 [Rhizomicrobium sp.]|jgi:hypothetical protein
MNMSAWICAILFIIEKDDHFGWWHWAPHSDAELIADGIAFLIFAVAFAAGKRGA